ncbi:MAG: hypothetical protein EOL87_12200 [Spartobacteria bacterium]|nr:hypothetical protein [Spartobacteria bacterium]
MNSDISIFEQYIEIRSQVERFLKRIEALFPDWVDWKQAGLRSVFGRSGRVQVVGNRPVMTCVFSGPSGAGKSSLFNAWTGAQVPVGVIRPQTRATCAAVPRSIADELDISSMFHEFEFVQPLKDPSILRDRDESNGLYVTRYTPPVDGPMHVLLADCPDFNSVEKENWDKARRMIALADVVIFMVELRSYANEECMSCLLDICKVAGQLFYVFTMSNEQDARLVHEDLLSRKVLHYPGFDHQRSDGQDCLTFLRRSAFYYEPYVRSGKAIDVLSLETGKPLYLSLFQDTGSGVMLQSLREATRMGCKDITALCQTMQDRAQQVERLLLRANQTVCDELEKMTLGVPVGVFLRRVVETANEMRPKWMRIVAYPVTVGAALGRSAAHQVKNVAGQLKGLMRQAKDIELTEKEILVEHVEHVVDAWRKDGLSISPDLVAIHLSRLLQIPLPKSTSDWVTTVDKDIAVWVRQRKWFVYLGVINDLAILLGSVCLFVDVVSTTISGVIIPAVVTQVTGLIMKVLEEFQLTALLRKANKRWVIQRREELRQHVWQQMARPLFAAAMEKEEEDIRRCDVDALRALSQKLEQSLQQMEKGRV